MNTKPITDYFGTQIIGSSLEELLSLERERIIELFKERGALWFRGFGVDLDQFNGFTSTFSTDFMDYRGGGYIRKRVDGGDTTLLSVNYDHGREKQDTFGLPLHGEMYYTDRRPAMLWFYCRHPAAEKGETTLCDGAMVFESLLPEHQDLLEQKRLRYLRKYREDEWKRIYQTEDIDEAADFAREGGLTVEIDRDEKMLHTQYVHPAVITSRWGSHRVFINNMLTVLWQERVLGLTKSIVRFEDGSEVPDALVEDVRGVQQRLVQPIAWAAGDIAMIDNSRVLHGRHEFSDPSRDVYLRMVRGIDF